MPDKSKVETPEEIANRISREFEEDEAVPKTKKDKDTFARLRGA